MKYTFILAFLIFSLSIIAQNKIELRISNQEPRVGEAVNLSIVPDLMTEFLKSKFDNSVEFSKSIGDDFMSLFKRVIVFNEEKTYEIGPYEIEFNGAMYVTNTISVKVRPALSGDGLWVRLLEFNGEKYIELEQKVTEKSKKSSGLDYSYYSSSSNTSLPILAELKTNFSDGIILENPSVKTNTSNGVTTCIKRYKISFTSFYDNSYILTKNDFYNLPEKYEIGEIILKK